MRFESKLLIPNDTLGAIISINKQHKQYFGNIRAITDALKIQSPVLTQINNLDFAISGSLKQITAFAAQQRNWTIIDDYEEVAEQILEFSESLTNEITIEQQRKFQALLSLIIAFVNKHKQKANYAFRFLEVVLVFYSVYSIILPQTELAKKEDIKQIDIKQDTLIHYINLVKDQLRIAKEYRITNRACEVTLKPKIKTLTLSKLPKDFEVIQIQIHHKWVYVSYLDPKDNLPNTGWIIKKYVDKPE